MRPTWLAGAVIVAALAGCGSDSDDGGEKSEAPEQTSQAEVKPKPAKPRCRKAPKVLVDALTETLTADGGGELRKANYLHVDDAPDAPLSGFKDGVYVVSAQLVAPGVDSEVLSWAASREMVRTGGGLAFGIGSVTREFSDLGSAATPGSPAADYTDAIGDTEAFEQSQRCAEG